MRCGPGIDELRQHEQLCLEQAELCATPEGKIALLELAAGYRTAIERISEDEIKRSRPHRAPRPSGKA